jgi:hypothetical protein
MHTKKGLIKPLIEKDLLLAFGKRGGLFTIVVALTKQNQTRNFTKPHLLIGKEIIDC